MHLSTPQLKHKGFPLNGSTGNSLLVSARSTGPFDISVMYKPVVWNTNVS